MANESNAQGILALIGNWSDESTAALTPVLNCCASWYYRLECAQNPTPQQRRTEFTGVGRYDFSTNLSQLQPWLLNWAKERRLPNLPAQVEQLLRLMEQQDLKLLFYFEDEDGEELFDHEVGLLSAQRGQLLYDVVSRSKASSTKKPSTAGNWYYEGTGGAVTVPEGVKKLAAGAFLGRTDLTAVTFPDTLTAIGNMAFLCCDALESVAIPSGVTKLGLNAFRNCSSLRAARIASETLKLSPSIFADCPNLTIYAPEGSLAEQFAKKRHLRFQPF